MTNVTFYLDSADKYVGFEVIGHTGFAMQGEDILCAAISMLSQAVITGILTIIQAAAEIRMDSRTATMSALVIDSEQRKVEDADLLIRTMHRSFIAIEDQYIQFVHIEAVGIEESSKAKLWNRVKNMKEVSKQ